MQRRSLLPIALVILCLIALWPVVFEPIDKQVGEKKSAPELESATPGVQSNEATDASIHTPENNRSRIEGETPHNNWVVRGTAILRDKSPAVNVALTAKLYEGYGPNQRLIAEEEIITKEDGSFSWAQPLPDQSVNVSIGVKRSSEITGYGDSARILKSQPPPQDLVAHIFPIDTPAIAVVLDHEKNPILGATVLTAFGESETDMNGEAKLRVSSGYGQVQAFARADGFAQQELIQDLAQSGITRIEFQLHPGYEVSGKIVALHGTPIEGVEIQVFGVQRNKVKSAEDGTFRLAHLDPDQPRATLYAKKTDYVEARVDLRPEQEGLNELIVVLQRGCRVTGNIIDESGKAVEAANIFIGRTPSSYGRLDSYSNEVGQFEFPCVSPGSQLMHISALNYAPQTINFEIPAGAISIPEIDVVLNQGSFLEGVVVEPNGKPVPAAYIYVRDKKTYTGQKTQCDDDGMFRFESIPEQGCILEVYCEGYSRNQVTIKATDLNQSNFRIILEPSGKIAGRVVNGITGESIQNFRVVFMQLSKPEKNGRPLGMPSGWYGNGKQFAGTNGYWDSGKEDIPMDADLTIRVIADGFGPANPPSVRTTADPQPDDFIVRLFPGITISGMVIDQDTLQAIADCRILCLTEDQWMTYYDPEHQGIPVAHSNAVGQFVFMDLSPGSYYLRANHRDYAAGWIGPLQTSPVGTTSVNPIELGKGAVLSGTAYKEDGSALADAPIGLSGGLIAGSRSYSRETKTDLNGHFEFPLLSDGKYNVKILEILELRRTVLALVPATIENGENVRVELHLPVSDH
jgi:carboxypeptidase family protein